MVKERCKAAFQSGGNARRTAVLFQSRSTGPRRIVPANTVSDERLGHGGEDMAVGRPGRGGARQALAKETEPVPAAKAPTVSGVTVQAAPKSDPLVDPAREFVRQRLPESTFSEQLARFRDDVCVKVVGLPPDRCDAFVAKRLVEIAGEVKAPLRAAGPDRGHRQAQGCADRLPLGMSPLIVGRRQQGSRREDRDGRRLCGGPGAGALAGLEPPTILNRMADGCDPDRPPRAATPAGRGPADRPPTSVEARANPDRSSALRSPAPSARPPREPREWRNCRPRV